MTVPHRGSRFNWDGSPAGNFGFTFSSQHTGLDRSRLADAAVLFVYTYDRRHGKVHGLQGVVVTDAPVTMETFFGGALDPIGEFVNTDESWDIIMAHMGMMR